MAALTKRIKAFCFQCVPSRDDCLDVSCPFYDLRKYNEGEVIKWWNLPKKQWEEAAYQARVNKVLIEADITEPTEAQIAHRQKFAEMKKKEAKKNKRRKKQ